MKGIDHVDVNLFKGCQEHKDGLENVCMDVRDK